MAWNLNLRFCFARMSLTRVEKVDVREQNVATAQNDTEQDCLEAIIALLAGDQTCR